MKNRLLSLPQHQHFMLFGARNTGKSTLVKHAFLPEERLYIDLLDLQEERKYLRDPQQFKAEVLALPEKIQFVIIDEIQKIPDLLNVVHALMSESEKVFVLTGSSARKLKHGHANLLAGRAFVKYLFPFTSFELGKDFNLDKALAFGLLPRIYTFKKDEDRAEFLRTYSHVYLKEEIWAEHLIRKLEPFQYFLEIAAQSNGDILNTANIARDVGVDNKTIAQYFSILEDTLIGFHLSAFKKSFRKRLNQKPKFYFFDTGVVRALSRTLSLSVLSGTYEYGKLFEHFIILECWKLSHYFYPDDRLSYLRTHEGLEVDLIIERLGKPLLCIEIKSSTDVRKDHLKHLINIEKEFDKKAEYICLSQVKRAMKFGDITVYPWQEGLEKIYPHKL
jgi:predicted AAA+ superfamily ATPase